MTDYPLPDNMQTNEIKRGGSKIILLIVGIFALILLAGAGVFFLMKSSRTISDADFTQGTSVDVEENSAIKFNLNEESHKITVNSVKNDSVSITLQSASINATLNTGETKKFDLDLNGTYDISIKLNNITDRKADLYLKKISEIACEEDWGCDEWETCVNETQTRKCEDANNCGTLDGKPAEARECEAPVLLNCSAQSGFLCNATETCSGTLKNSSDGNCCAGNCIPKQTGPINCAADMTCLINAAKDCTIANVTYPFGESNSTWMQNYSYYYKIRGFEGENCRLYQEILSVLGKYTASKRSSLANEGKNQTEIDQMESNLNSEIQGLVGQTGICRFSVYALEEYLTEVKEESYKLTEEDIIDYECSGNLYGL